MKTELVQKNVLLIHKVLRDFKIYPDNNLYEDLYSSGKLGLVEAALQFESKRNIKFSTFAYYKIYRKVRATQLELLDPAICYNSPNTLYKNHRTLSLDYQVDGQEPFGSTLISKNNSNEEDMTARTEFKKLLEEICGGSDIFNFLFATQSYNEFKTPEKIKDIKAKVDIHFPHINYRRWAQKKERIKFFIRQRVLQLIRSNKKYKELFNEQKLAILLRGYIKVHGKKNRNK